MNITPPEPPESNILPIDQDAAKILEIQLLEQKIPYCENYCRRVWTDTHRRILICRDCGKAIEAFDYVKQWAHDADRRNTGLKSMVAKTRIAQAQFDDLERRVNNLRAQLKRLGVPQPELERMDYRQALLNSHHDMPPSVVRQPLP